MKLKVGGGEHEANHMLSCASCMRSAHEHGCAKEAELIHEQYWQCEECRALGEKNHPAYLTLQQQTFENIHKKKMSKLNSLIKWNIKNGNKHDRITEQKSMEKTKTKKKDRPTRTNQ
jgi:hypothetical protein